MLSTLRFATLLASGLLLALALTSCPRKAEGPAAQPATGPKVTKGSQEDVASRQQPVDAPFDGTEQSGGAADAAARPSVADYLSGKAGTELVMAPNGIALPQGWPLPAIAPPADATVLEGGQSRQPYSGGVYWLLPFSSEQGYTAVVASIEVPLKSEGFRMVKSPATPRDPEIDEKGAPTVGYTEGTRAYLSQDGRTLLMLTAKLRQQPSSPGEPTSRYELQLIYLEAPMPMPPGAELKLL